MPAIAPAVIHETHVSLTVLMGDRAYKVKKPVRLPYLDFSTRERRERACHREVELNRRICPDVYLGVLDVADEAGTPCEHLVAMRRMPAERRLSTLATAGGEVDVELARLAVLLARFHAGAERSPLIDSHATRDAVAARWDVNVSELRAFERFLDPRAVAEVERLAHRYLAGRAALFQQRIDLGLVVDGHGDLLADDIYLMSDGPRVLDCIEFSDELRHVDVLDDAAFLAMDLERLGRGDLGRPFLARYCEASAERHPATLADHYIAYRASVRAKVAAVRASQGGSGAAEEARCLLEMARAHLHAGRVRMVLLGGPPGTGKTTVAAALACRLGWQVVRSDIVRKELADLDRSTPAPAGFGADLYDASHTDATYAEMLARAGELLELGECVVLDATWSDQAKRMAARQVAHATSSDLFEVRCETAPCLAAARLRARGPDASDATPAIASAIRDRFDPWPEAALLDTTGPVAEAVEAAVAAVAAEAGR